MDDLEAKIVTAADRIRSADKATKRLIDALEGKDIMIRWTRKAAPGQSSYDSVKVTRAEVEGLLRAILEPDIEAANELAQMAVSDVIGATQPGAGDC